MKRILVIGCPGSGKSTFSEVLAKKLDLPLYHLDLFFWNEDKTTVPLPDFLRHLRHVLAEDRWIIDGNYGSTMELRVAACDTVFFLDYPLEVCLAGLRERKGKALAHQPFYTPSDEKNEAFLDFVLNYKEQSRPKVLALFDRYPDKKIVVFKNREEASAYLNRL